MAAIILYFLEIIIASGIAMIGNFVVDFIKHTA